MAEDPRVLIVVENLSVPRDRRVWQQALTLTAAGYEVVVVCPQGVHRDRESYELRDGVEIHRYPPSVSDGSLRGYTREYGRALWETARLTRRLARERPFDVIQACNPPDIMLLAVLPQRLRGTRLVFDQHDLVPELFAARFGGRHGVARVVAVALERLAFALADTVISTNESFRRVAVERGGKRPEDVFVVRNGPDRDVFRPGPARAGLRRRRHLLGYVGTMGPQDGVEHALRALAALAHRRDDWTAVLAGDGDALPELRRTAGALGLDDVVSFTGFLDVDGVVELLRSVDVCISPEPSNPLNDASTLIKVAEYMAVGRPVVCFDLPETRVTAGDAAAYARPNDEAEFAARIAELLDDPVRCAAMGAEGRTRVERKLSWEYSARELLRAYAHCLAQTGKRTRPGHVASERAGASA